MPRREGESEHQRLDRNFDDLLQELRVSQNGTQILFAFLLTVPFSTGFKSATSFERGVYFTALLLSGMSAAMLIAPAAMHRVLFRTGLKKQLVYSATRVTLGGQALLTVAVSMSVLFVGDYLYGVAAGVVLAVLMFLFWTTWFFLLPLEIRRRAHRQAETTDSV